MAVWMLIGLLLIHVIAAQDCPSNKVLSDSSGNITSPGYPGVYAANLTCNWVIEAPAGKHIKLQFTYMHIENCGYHCNCDGIKLSVGKTSTDRKSLICQNSVNSPNDWGKPVYSIFNKIWLSFYSTEGPSHYKGFAAKYEIIDYTPPDCPSDAVIHSGNSGSLSSPNYPNNYPNERHCYWLISVTDGPRAKLSFTNFTLEETGCKHSSEGKCTCDYLKVYDGENNSTLAELCGHALPKPIISNSKKILIEFMSGLSINFKGFKAEYTSTSEQPSVTPGGGGSLTTTAAPSTNLVYSTSGVVVTESSTNASNSGSTVVIQGTTASPKNRGPIGTASGTTSLGITTILALVVSSITYIWNI